MQTDLELHLGDYVDFLLKRDIPNSHHHLLLACMPKSGSTWLCMMLSCLPGFQSAVLVNGFDRREQELSEIQLLLNRRWNYVSQMHIRYSEPTARLMQTFCLKPIVLVRNIFDIVPSFRDRWHCEGARGPAGYLGTEMTGWPTDKVDEFVVDMVLPWYFNFFLSWTECEIKLLLTYEEMRQDPHQVLEKVCKHYSIDATRSQIDDAVRSAATSSYTRRNKAEIGRGESLSAVAKQRIRTMASYYEGTDFTPIGISSDPHKSQGHDSILSSRISINPKSATEALIEPKNRTSRACAEGTKTRQTADSR